MPTQILILTLSLLFSLTLNLNAQLKVQKQESASEQIARATQKLSQSQTYLLQYKLKKGEVIQMAMEQVVNTKCQMGGITEPSSSRTASTRTWKVIDVDQLGNMTFSLNLDSIDMWQKIGEADPISFNSETDKDSPDDFQFDAQYVGKTLSIYTIEPSGKIIDKKSNLTQYSLGFGNITIKLPKQPIPVGYQWHIPTVLEADDENGINRKLKARIVYKLDKVKDGNAYIKMRTEVLTPIKSQKIKSTIMQKLSNGYFVFSIPKGRMLLRQYEWDDRAHGFAGPDSFLEYIGRMTQKIMSSDKKTPRVSSLRPLQPTKDKKAVKLRTRNEGPTLRK
ncbi:MAG: hypothetical protein AAF939_21210 [Planctomycetota bacterium]